MGSANIYLAGISHECVDVSKIGRYSIPPELCLKAQSEMLRLPSVGEAVVLSTCNRVEVYFSASEAAAAADVLNCIPKACGRELDMRIFRESGYFKENGDAVSHLFEVASGLRSQMLGETEIFGQVKAAYGRSRSSGHCGPVFNPLFQKAFQCAKWIRTNTDIGRGKISVGSVCSELASRIFGDLKTAKILLLGSGGAGRLVADALYVRGAHGITVASRTRANADSLAEKIGCLSAGMVDVLGGIAEFDIVIGASSSAGDLLGANAVSDAVAARGGRPVFLIDLGVPCNIDPKCAEVDDVYLYNLDDLAKIAAENIAARKSEIEGARDVIRRRASYFAQRISGAPLRKLSDF